MKKNKLYSPHLREESLQETVYQVKEGLISKRGEGGIGAVKKRRGEEKIFLPIHGSCTCCFLSGWKWGLRPGPQWPGQRQHNVSGSAPAQRDTFEAGWELNAIPCFRGVDSHMPALGNLYLWSPGGSFFLSIPLEAPPPAPLQIFLLTLQQICCFHFLWLKHLSTFFCLKKCFCHIYGRNINNWITELIMKCSFNRRLLTASTSSAVVLLRKQARLAWTAALTWMPLQ